jgi:hypothetical protein
MDENGEQTWGEQAFALHILCLVAKKPLSSFENGEQKGRASKSQILEVSILVNAFESVYFCN